MIETNVKALIDRVDRAAADSGRRAGDIVIVGASKLKPAEAIKRAIGAGIRDIGENRVQEFLQKDEEGAYAGARKHFIGHLQSNKASKIVGVADLIQSLDSYRLMALIDRLAGQLGITQELLIQINIGGETSKRGIAPAELPELLGKAGLHPNIKVRGLMSIPPVQADGGSNPLWFAKLYKLFVDIRAEKYDNVSMDYLSMGMSGDFEQAICEGSNMIRPGSVIFGQR